MNEEVKSLDEKDLNLLDGEEAETGASMLEYALLAALIAVVCIAAITFLGNEASEAFDRIAGSIQNANNT